MAAALSRCFLPDSLLNCNWQINIDIGAAGGYVAIFGARLVL